ncbi:MAG: cytochrome C [Pseudomonadota bacterium]
MKFNAIALTTGILAASSALADGHVQGDAEKGMKEFNKCKACHMIQNDETGEMILRGGKTGPNLWDVIGRQAGTREDFRYGKDLVAAGEAGLVWDFDTFTRYVVDPRKFLQETLEDTSARSRMTFKLRRGGEDIHAYLVSVSPEPAPGESEDATN